MSIALAAPILIYVSCGPDALGRDLLSRILFGARLSIRVARAVIELTVLAIGIMLGGGFGVDYSGSGAEFRNLDSIGHDLSSTNTPGVQDPNDATRRSGMALRDSQSMVPGGTTHSHRWPVTRAIRSKPAS